ncbi:gustatory receptor [Homalodisca vitripennis]|nr:gustatory receptor [Homalodisca vitripennis]
MYLKPAVELCGNEVSLKQKRRNNNCRCPTFACDVVTCGSNLYFRAVTTLGFILSCPGFFNQFSGDNLKSATGKRLTFSPAVFCWGLTVTILQTGLLGFVLFEDLLKGLSIVTNTNINVNAFITLNITTMMITVFSFYNCARKYSRFLDVCDTLERFDRSLQLTPSKRWMTVKFTTLIAILTVTPIISGGTFLYQILNLAQDYELIISHIIVIACSMIANYIQICILVQFHEVTHCIGTRFRLINARIRQEVTIQSYRQIVLRQSPRCINRGQERNSNNKIKTFMSAYQMLRFAVNLSNGFYSDLLLSLICYKFVHLTITLYTFFLSIQSGPLSFIEKGLWILCHIGYMIQIVSSSNVVTQAADETSPIICKLINKDLYAGLKRQLESFLLQLAVQNLGFSAKGGFKINSPMLTTMAATVITYLVILIQFQTETYNDS